MKEGGLNQTRSAQDLDLEFDQKYEQLLGWEMCVLCEAYWNYEIYFTLSGIVLAKWTVGYTHIMTEKHDICNVAFFYFQVLVSYHSTTLVTPVADPGMQSIYLRKNQPIIGFLNWNGIFFLFLSIYSILFWGALACFAFIKTCLRSW